MSLRICCRVVAASPQVSRPRRARPRLPTVVGHMGTCAVVDDGRATTLLRAGLDLLARDRRAAALEALRDAAALAEDGTSPTILGARTQRALGRALVAVGRHRQALLCLDSARRQYAGLGRLLAVAGCDEHAAEALHALGRDDEALEALQRAWDAYGDA